MTTEFREDTQIFTQSEYHKEAQILFLITFYLGTD